MATGSGSAGLAATTHCFTRSPAAGTALFALQQTHGLNRPATPCPSTIALWSSISGRPSVPAPSFRTASTQGPFLLAALPPDPASSIPSGLPQNLHDHFRQTAPQLISAPASAATVQNLALLISALPKSKRQGAFPGLVQP